MDAYSESTSAAYQNAPIMHLVDTPDFVPQGVVRRLSVGDLFEALNTQVFIEEPDTSTGFKFLTKQ